MSSRVELLELDEDLQWRKLELFEQEYITTKHELLGRIKDIVRRTQGQIARLSPEDLEMKEYLVAKKYNLEEFEKAVSYTPLFENLENWWCYEFVIGSFGTALYLRHVSCAEICGDEDNQWLEIEEYDACFKLIVEKCALLTAEEFAIRTGVEPSTIRVWIRRGKIRTAIKTGNGWSVPELTSPLKRGFHDAKYEWDTYLTDVPEGFSLIEEPGEILIRKSHETGKYIVWYYSQDKTICKDYMVNTAEKEKLELFLISQASVEYTGDQERICQ